MLLVTLALIAGLHAVRPGIVARTGAAHAFVAGIAVTTGQLGVAAPAVSWRVRRGFRMFLTGPISTGGRLVGVGDTGKDRGGQAGHGNCAGAYRPPTSTSSASRFTPVFGGIHDLLPQPRTLRAGS
jgi:hypothetical protein